uniref:Uncharacterized protein n=1 Tax=Arundo donax TaxID=35708 RepID=A0A0A9H523_ARUDO
MLCQGTDNSQITCIIFAYHTLCISRAPVANLLRVLLLHISATSLD